MISPISLTKLADQTNGKLSGEELSFGSISIDTRTINEGDLFIAIKGESFDGHHYIKQAINAGCCALVINDSVKLNAANTVRVEQKKSKPYLYVNDTQKALGEVASLNRQSFSGTVFGITGSSGKTSTKNMLAAILNEKGKTCATEGNFNNEIGVPLTLLNIDASHSYAVIEMGARSKGDICYLANFVRPDVAILLNAGSSHIDIFGSYQHIVEAKGEIFESLSDEGVAIINVDDPAIAKWEKLTEGKRTLSFSLADINADVYASETSCEVNGSVFNLNYAGEVQKINLPIPGEHNVLNSLAATAAALAIGFELQNIANGLAKLKPTSGRLNTTCLQQNISVIDDSYNANPASVKASLDVLALRNGLKVAVLGEMGELGKHALDLHLEVAEYGSRTSIEQFLLIGPHAEDMALKLDGRGKTFSSKQEIFDHLCAELTGEETILVKGSRSAGMDEIVNLLKGRFA